MDCSLPHFQFQSTLPIQGATSLTANKRNHFAFQSTLPIQGATIKVQIEGKDYQFQSTLPIQGATTTMMLGDYALLEISIHAPNTGSDKLVILVYRQTNNFNPRSQYRERRQCDRLIGQIANFNPRSQYRERRVTTAKTSLETLISIHAPNTGSDLDWQPVGFTTSISIHAPNTGSDGWRM